MLHNSFYIKNFSDENYLNLCGIKYLKAFNLLTIIKICIIKYNKFILYFLYYIQYIHGKCSITIICQLINK